MLRISVFDSASNWPGTRRWRELENGPFPITTTQLHEARERFRREWDACGPLDGCRQSPQTAARDILREVAPHLSDFDRLMVGFAVTNPRIRVAEAD